MCCLCVGLVLGTDLRKGSVCVSLCQCSFVCVRHSIFYVCVTCYDLDVTIRLSETAREKARGSNICVSLCQCSFVCVRHSIFCVCVTCHHLHVTIRLSETAREKARGNNNGLSHVTSKRKEEIKSGPSGCGAFVVPYFHRPFISIYMRGFEVCLCLSLIVLRRPCPVNRMLKSNYSQTN